MYIESTNKQGTFRGDEQGHKLLKLIDDMGWDTIDSHHQDKKPMTKFVQF